MRSFNTWRCETGVNWQIGNTSSVDVAEKDDVNLILFDDNDPLNEGVLGVCINYFTGCAQGANILWYADELDIIFRTASNFPVNRGWNFTTNAPTGNEMDFETVATHELGHGQAFSSASLANFASIAAFFASALAFFASSFSCNSSGDKLASLTRD